MKGIALAVLMSLLAGCGARVLEVKTARGGVCFLCLDKPEKAEVDKLLLPAPRIIAAAGGSAR